MAVLGGRVVLAVLLVLGWELGARTFGAVFFVAARCGHADRQAGGEQAPPMSPRRSECRRWASPSLASPDLLPFLLRRSPRLSEAVEPYIMASMGIPKYALAPWLILWFGIGDMPKLVVVTLMVFYIIFITTTAGIRGVDQRLVNMARIAGAGEAVIAREIIWKSLCRFSSQA